MASIVEIGEMNVILEKFSKKFCIFQTELQEDKHEHLAQILHKT